MDPELVLNAFDAIIVLGVSIPTVFMATKIPIAKLRNVSVVLASFLVIHGFYHLLALLNAIYSLDIFDFLSDGVVEPVSYLVFLVFALLVYQMGRGPTK